MSVPLVLPYPANERITYFLMQAPNLRSLCVSKQRSVWMATLPSIMDINNALQANERVVLFFSVRGLRGIYGMATVLSIIPPPPIPLPAFEFEVSWIRTFRVSLRLLTVAKNLPPGTVGGRSVGEGRLDRIAGHEIMLMAYRKPVWDWTADHDKVIPFAAPSNAALPDNILFSEEWITRSLESGNQPRRQDFNRQPRTGQSQTFNPRTPTDFYTGDIPGFVFTARSSMLEEIFHRFVFALPPQLMVYCTLFILSAQSLI